MTTLPPFAHVLVVEDDDAIREAICETLRDEGYEATAAATLTEARQALRTSPAVVLVDLMLQGESGETLLEELADIGSAPPRALVSASRDAAAIAARHHVPLLKKPFALCELLSMIRVLAATR